MRFALAFVFIFLLTGCASAGPQPKLPVTHIAIETPQGVARFNVEVARTQREQARGLMYRTAMAPDAGMLFDFQPPRFVSFWMKNTVLALDILFVRSDGTVAGIAANTVPYSLTSIRSEEPVRAVIEINAGRARALGIVPGSRVRGGIFGG